LKAVSSPLTQSCINFIALHDSCKTDIDAHCPGKEYTSDALLCLTEWTKGLELQEACKEALPKKEEKKKEPLSEESKRKADQRRR
jgi:hypothetical protein